jgi:two-component sensor histidine kinase
MRRLLAGLHVVGFWCVCWAGLAQTPSTAVTSYAAGVTNLEERGATFPDGPLFVQKDTSGFVWFFTDLAAFQYDGNSFRKHPFYELFGVRQKSIREFLRGVIRLPNGHWALHFDDIRYGMPVHDTLCVLDPYLVAPGDARALPPLGSLKTHGHCQPEEPDGWSTWLATDTARRHYILTFNEETTSWETTFTSSIDMGIQPLYSSKHCGEFYLLAEEGSDSLQTLHCLNGDCQLTRPSAFKYARPTSQLRQHQHHTMWCRADGSILMAVWRHESCPPFQGDPYWVQTREGDFMPDTSVAGQPDWSTFLHLGYGFRGSNVTYQAERERLWVLVENRLRIFDIRGAKVADVPLPASTSFTKGLHDVQFIRENEAILLSSFGIFHVQLVPSPFSTLNLDADNKEFTLGWRDMTSWNEDTLLMMTDASGLYSCVNGHFNRMIETGRAGIHAESETLFVAKPEQFLTIPKLNLDRTTLFPANHGRAWTLARASGHEWLIGHEGLDVFSTRTGTSETFLKGINTYHFHFADSLWLVCHGQGLAYLTKDLDSLGSASDMFPELDEISTSCYQAMTTDAGEIWVGTKGQGVARWNPGTREVTWYSTENGLPSDQVYATMQDAGGHVWGSTNKGLFRLDPRTGGISVFGFGNGLDEIEFNRTSWLHHTNGQMFVGGIANVTAFDPANPVFLENSDLPRPHAIAIEQHLRADRGVVNITREFRKNGKISMGPNDDFLGIQLVVPDMTGTRHEFAHRLVPREETAHDSDIPWTSLQGNLLRISQLEPGNWRLEIKAKNAKHGWLPNQVHIPIDVTFPFYLTRWFVLALLGGAFGAYAIGSNVRNRNLKHRNELLEQQVRKRTENLHKALSLKDAYLAETHHRVKNNLQMVASLLDLQAAQIEDPQTRAPFDVSKTRIDAIALIHQRLYGRDGEKSIRFQGFLAELLELIEQGQTSGRQRLIATIAGDDFDLRLKQGVALGMIFNELVTNSLKHASGSDGLVKVDVTMAWIAEGRLRFAYDDHGPGIDPSLPFEERTSLGLRLVGRFAHQLQGHAAVDPERPSRIVFEVNISV